MSIRNLRAGMRGPDVKAIQEALNVWGAKPLLIPDGKFGPITDAAVRKFQKAHDLKDDGIVGHDTRRALFPVGVATTTIFAMRLRMPALPPLLRR
jgi:peptidoglycan hydrolase-like protein with peptidoglycan-binding domain